jgi:hypothetical protein
VSTSRYVVRYTTVSWLVPVTQCKFLSFETLVEPLYMMCSCNGMTALCNILCLCYNSLQILVVRALHFSRVSFKMLAVLFDICNLVDFDKLKMSYLLLKILQATADFNK